MSLIRIAAAFALVGFGCAGDLPGGPPPGKLGDDGPADSPWPPLDDSGTTTMFEPGDDTGDPTDRPPDLGECDGDEDCTYTDDGGCFEPGGVCEFAVCQFDPKPDGAPCVSEGVTGMCSGGVCGGGGDDGPQGCEAGRADCNADPADGCETELGTAQDCGFCNDTCDAGPNASASCSAGSCELSCIAPFEDCDGNPSNGCEIPTGVPNRCDVDGLNSATGCWTAHCGQSFNVDARNFSGNWFCFECTNCTVPVAGQVAWCSHSSGRWFPMEAGSCIAASVDYTDLVCSP